MIPRLAWFRFRRSRAALVAAAAVISLLAGAHDARADVGESDSESDSDTVRPYGHRTIPESPQHFAFEARFGPYRPDIDSAFSGKAPYEQVFGTDHHLFFGFEFDWQALRIPMLGTLGAGFGLGYTSVSATARITGTSQLSSEDTWLKIMPTYLVGVLRVDVLARETPVPLVPYAKLGFGYGLYWTGTDLGTDAKGHAAGTHVALGAMLLLDNFDEDASLQLDNDVGINNTYVFFEWYKSNLDGFGDTSTLRVGTSSWVLGLAFEM